jgi:hypothetical protein
MKRTIPGTPGTVQQPEDAEYQAGGAATTPAPPPPPQTPP